MARETSHIKLDADRHSLWQLTQVSLRLFSTFWKPFPGNREEMLLSQNNVHWTPQRWLYHKPVRGNKQDLTFRTSSTYSMSPQLILPLTMWQVRVNEEKPMWPHSTLTVNDSLYERVSFKLARHNRLSESE